MRSLNEKDRSKLLNIRMRVVHFQSKNKVVRRGTMTYRIRIAVSPYLPRASYSVLAVTAWLIMSALAAGQPCYEARTQTGSADIGTRPLSGRQARGYCSCEQHRPSRVDLQSSASELKIRILICFQS